MSIASLVTNDTFNDTDGLPLSLEHVSETQYAAALFYHSARLRPFARPYLRQQQRLLSEDSTSPRLNNLARCCRLVAQRVKQGDSMNAVLTRLQRNPLLREPVEYIARALLNIQAADEYRDTQRDDDNSQLPRLPYPFQDQVKPAPASLMRALLQWPDNDKLLVRILAILHAQPSLASLFCEYATAYTAQGKLLQLKPALLLVGPVRSRELVLLAHFESNLTQPVFPLRNNLLQRRHLIKHCLHHLSESMNIALPVRSELLTYLLVYDAWHCPRWTTAAQWRTDKQLSSAHIHSWLATPKPQRHRVAKRLIHYWQLPETVAKLLDFKHSDTRLNALLALSISAVACIEANFDIQQMNDGHHGSSKLLQQWLREISEHPQHTLSLAAYYRTVKTAANELGYHQQLPARMRP